MRKLIGIAVLLLVVLSVLSPGPGTPPAAGADPALGPKPPGRAPALPAESLVDRDGNRVLDNLDARLAAVDDEHRFPVIVLFNRPPSEVDLPGVQHRLGGFAVRHRFTIVNGIAATLSKRQITAASQMPLVRQIEYDMPVRATLDEASYWFGVQAARAAFGVDGNADGSPSFSANDVVIAVVDTGVDPNHADLDGGKIIAWHDIVAGATTPYDDQGHGTHVASIAAGTGEGRPDRLYQGVAPGAALVGVKVLDSSGQGPTSDVVAGVEWVVAHKDDYGIRIVSLSIGDDAGSSNGDDAFSLALDAAADAGIVPVVAAGNSGPWRNTIFGGAAARKAVTVGAAADEGELGFNLAPFSSRGPTADGRIKPDIVAPGYQITAAAAGTGNGYTTLDGTSMATPFTSGVVALMLQRNPALTPAQVKALLQATAEPFGPSGPDNEFGHGRLDPLAAIAATVPGTAVPAGPPLPPHVFFGGHLTGARGQAWHDFQVADLANPLALTLNVRNAECSSSLLGVCFGATVDFDLELYAPDGSLVASSTLPDRQDTINFMPDTTGTYRARVYVCSDCGSNDDYWLDVSGATTPTAVQAALSAAPLTGTAPLAVTFSNDSTGSYTSRLWSFGDGATSPDEDPSHTYAAPGVYTVTLTVSNTVASDTLIRPNYVAVAESRSSIHGSVGLQGRQIAAPADPYAVPLRLQLFPPGGSTAVYSTTVQADGFAHFTATDILPGSYDVRLKTGHALANLEQNVALGLGTNDLDLCTLLEGDASDDNQINITDFSLLAATYGKSRGQPGWDGRADFNESAQINITDFSLLSANYGMFGDQSCTSPSIPEGVGPLALPPDAVTALSPPVRLALAPGSAAVRPGGVVELALQVEAGTQPVDSVAAYLRFDPKLLQVVDATGQPATSVERTSAPLGLELENAVDNARGQINLSVGTLGATKPSGTFTVALIRLKALRGLGGGTKVEFAFEGQENRQTDVLLAGNSVLGEAAGTLLGPYRPRDRAAQ